MGYTKHQCFFLDSCDDEQHYIKKDWLLVTGRFNIYLVSLVDPKKLYLPPKHIKLGLFKNFVKAINQGGCGFRYLQQKFSAKSKAKLKTSIFIEPEIRKLMNGKLFKENLNPLGKEAWNQFCLVVENFLANCKSFSYASIIQDFLSSYKNLRARMSLKIHFLHSHLDFFHRIWEK